MGKRLTKLIIYKVYKMRILSHEELRKMKYGMEVIFSELVKIIILVILFAALNRLKYFLFSLIILSTIRCFSGGLHFQKNLNYLLFSIIFFTASTHEDVYELIGSTNLGYPAMTISILTIGLFSPVASMKRESKNIRRMHLHKFTATIFTGLWVYILLFITRDPDLAACGILTIILQAFQLFLGFGLKHLKKSLQLDLPFDRLNDPLYII